MRERSAWLLPSAGKLGMWIFLVTDAMGFAALFTAYAALRVRAANWPAAGARLDVPLAAAMTLVLLGSSLTMALGSVLWTCALGLLFLVGSAVEWAALARHGVRFSTDSAASLFFVCTGWHGLHVAAGLVILGLVAWRRREALPTAALFWHFLDAVWMILFALVYLS